MKNYVSFFYVDCGDTSYRLMAEMMCASVRMVLPDYEIVLLTDRSTSNLVGADLDVRADVPFSKSKLMPSRLLMMHAFLNRIQNGNVIFCDPDILFLKETDIFHADFDVCLTSRDDFPSMPFNTGIMGTRPSKASIKFWKYAYDICEKLPTPLHSWYGDQLSISMIIGLNAFICKTGDTIQAGDALVKFISCNKYNYSPDEYEEHDADILHFKGARKELMAEYFSDLCEKYLGLIGGFFKLEPENIEILLKLSVQYQALLSIKLWERDKLFCVKYTIDIYDEYRKLAKYLPKSARKILDIGCGLGGINYFFYTHFKDQQPIINLMDKQLTQETSTSGCIDNLANGNHLNIAKKLLINAGVPSEKLTIIDLDQVDKVPEEEYDLVFSSISMVFSNANYLSKIIATLTTDGCLIIDIKKNSEEYKVLQKQFSNIQMIFNTSEFQRVCVCR